jgi:hypothetical protein
MKNHSCELMTSPPTSLRVFTPLVTSQRLTTPLDNTKSIAMLGRNLWFHLAPAHYLSPPIHDSITLYENVDSESKLQHDHKCYREGF